MNRFVDLIFAKQEVLSAHGKNLMLLSPIVQLCKTTRKGNPLRRMIADNIDVSKQLQTDLNSSYSSWTNTTMVGMTTSLISRLQERCLNCLL